LICFQVEEEKKKNNRLLKVSLNLNLKDLSKLMFKKLFLKIKNGDNVK